MEHRITTKIQESKEALLALCSDKESAEKLIENIISLQKQEDIEPTELHVAVNDVIDTIDLDSVCFKVCKTGILFHAKAGYTAWVEPRCRSLFGTLAEVLTEKKTLLRMSELEKRQVPEEEVENINQYLHAWVHILEMPIASAISPMILFNVASAFLKSFNEVATDLLNSPLHEETAEDLIANAEAEHQAEFLDAMAAQIKE